LRNSKLFLFFYLAGRSETQGVYLIPKLNLIFQKFPLQNTLVSGELVIDKIKQPQGGELETPRFLASDCVVFSKFDLSKYKHQERLKPIRVTRR
jgi:hypothetical protein